MKRSGGAASSARRDHTAAESQSGHDGFAGAELEAFGNLPMTDWTEDSDSKLSSHG